MFANTFINIEGFKVCIRRCMNIGGKMIEKGTDTFWEIFNPDNPDVSPYGGLVVHSFCHAWSCTPTYFLRKYFYK